MMHPRHSKLRGVLAVLAALYLVVSVVAVFHDDESSARPNCNYCHAAAIACAEPESSMSGAVAQDTVRRVALESDLLLHETDLIVDSSRAPPAL
jgi:hypothetical protein